MQGIHVNRNLQYMEDFHIIASYVPKFVVLVIFIVTM